MSEPAQASQATESEQAQADAQPQEAAEKGTDWKAQSRKWEERAKANVRAADEVTRLQAQHESDGKTISSLQKQLADLKTTDEQRQ